MMNSSIDGLSIKITKTLNSSVCSNNDGSVVVELKVYDCVNSAVYSYNDTEFISPIQA